MSKTDRRIEFEMTASGGNVFEDLGFPPDEARNLKIRSYLMSAVARVIEQQGLTQSEAAALMGTTQPRISELVRGHIEQFTIDSLVNMLSNAGVPVEIEIGDTAA